MIFIEKYSHHPHLKPVADPLRMLTVVFASSKKDFELAYSNVLQVRCPILACLHSKRALITTSTSFCFRLMPNRKYKAHGKLSPFD